MNQSEIIAMYAELEGVLNKWWEESNVDLPLVGHDGVSMMAQAVGSVVIALVDSQEYLRQEKMLID